MYCYTWRKSSAVAGSCSRASSTGSSQRSCLYRPAASTHTKWYADLFECTRHTGVPPAFGQFVDEFSARGLAGLKNGLDKGDNRSLLKTWNLDELIALILGSCSDPSVPM